MKKLIILLTIGIITIGCTTTQRAYLKKVPEQDPIIMEASGLGGFIIGVLSASLVYTIYDNVID